MSTTIEHVLKTIFQPYKGILAADERPSSMDRRLQEYGIADGDAMRSRYREILFSTPNLERTISGVILSEDTFAQHTVGDVLTRDFLRELGIAVGVKVDGGLESYAGSDTLQKTKGLAGLDDRCKQYREQGAGFTKWRSAIPVVGATDDFITTVATDMATYAYHALQNDLVPIIEPELLLRGDHTVEATAETFTRVLPAVLAALAEKKCNPQQCILKTSFITDGLTDGVLSADETAKRTLAVFRETKLDGNKGFYGIVFLSGGLESKTAIAYIQRIKALAEQEAFKTPLSFSYARALQEPVLLEWKGEETNVLNAQLAFTQTLQHAIKKYKGIEEAPRCGA
ncbi:MAG: fructose-bisphosphate aldolase class I [Candidatus Kaiserbacteria bacterium]|nr:fructose-bisphosphate aldolase class I [Candidatus Kaiserbacteria bacterium]